MTDPFKGRALSLSGPAWDIVPVIPDDVVLLSVTGVALYAEIGGSVRFQTPAGATRTVQVADLALLPVGVRQVFATGTTAVGLHVLTVSA